MIHVTHLTVERDCHDAVAVWQTFLEIVNSLAVCVLGSVKHDFPGGGLTGLVVLGESHAAIHTWPERGLIWCELATCGDPADCGRFRKRVSDWKAK